MNKTSIAMPVRRSDRFDPTSPPATTHPPSPAAGTPSLRVLPAPAPAPTPTPAPAPAPAPAGRSRLNFGAAKPAAKSTKTAYPVLPDPEGAYAKIAADFLQALADEETAAAAKERARGELIAAARPFHFQANHGHAEPMSSVSVLSPEGEVLVAFKDRYPGIDEATLDRVEAIVGPQIAADYFDQAFTIKLDSDKIPAERQQAVVDGLLALGAQLGLPQILEIKSAFKPGPAFHTARFSLLSPEQNVQLENLIHPEKGFCQAAVGMARGRK